MTGANLLCPRYYGLFGSIVRAIDPHTEADPLAILSQLQAAFGNVAGRGPHFMAEADRHGANLFVLNVGKSSKGRKGSSWGHVARLFSLAAPEWAGRIKNGLSSGEGLLWVIRDPAEGAATLSAGSDSSNDKRLLCMESEFASLLKVISREGNTLSPLLRNAWDGRTLSTLTRQDPLTVTDPHLSIVGHITETELLRMLNETEISNGLGNRFLFFLVKRSKLLPEGGRVDEQEIKMMGEEIRASLEFARNQGEMRRDARARELWVSVYPKLSEGRSGLAGVLDGRAEAQVMRVALIQALANRQSAITEECLQSALALHQSCQSSLFEIFGRKTGLKVADRVVEALERAAEGLSRTDLNALFRNNLKPGELDQALNYLSEHEIVQKRQSPTEGRSREIWILRERRVDDGNDQRGGPRASIVSIVPSSPEVEP